MESRSEKEKTYIHWTPEMDRSLSNVLLEEHSKGHKTPNGWKAVAFTAAIKGMKDTHDIDFTKEKIMARLKTWNKYYKEVSAMLDTSGFGWDWERNMVKVDSEEVWANYVKAHPNVRHYRDKVIINWGDLGILCGNDRATCSFAATANETVAALDEDSVGEESHIPTEPSSGGVEGSMKRKRKATPAEAITTAIGKMSVSLENAADAIRASGELRVVPPPLVYEALAKLPDDMPVNEIVRAMDLLGSSQHKFDTFLALPEHMRVAWLHLQFY